jgi:hypothetical protein
MHAPRAVASVFCAALILAGVVAPQAAAAKGTFNAGTATAIAQAVSVAPKTGGLAASVTIGTTIADYRGTLAQASSQTINLGVIGTTLTTQCDASPPTLTPDQLPKPLIAESDHGNSHATTSTAGTSKSGLLAVAGREVVRAKTQPSGTATFDGNAVVVPHLLTMSGLHTTSNAHIIKGKTRIATATSRIGALKLLGVISLGGLKWTASRRSGATNKLSTHFTMDSASIAGKKLPVTSPKSIGAAFDTINKTLKTTGLHLGIPQRSYGHGKLAMSPLTIGIEQSGLGNATLNPILTAITPLTNQVTNALIGINCKVGSVLSVIDLALSGIDGTGALDVSMGGVSAENKAKAYGNAFGHQKPPSLGGPQHHHSTNHRHTTTTTTGGGGSGGGGGGLSGGSDNTGQQTTDGGTSGTTSTSLSSSCATTSPAGRPTCSNGKGLVVGLGALGLLALFAGTDFFVLRRRRVVANPPGPAPGTGTA